MRRRDSGLPCSVFMLAFLGLLTITALLVHLDGSGAVTFLVTVPAMLPLYGRLGIDRRVLACVVSLAAGVNFLPWTGPMIRAAASLHIPVTQLFRPLVPVQAVGLTFVFTVAWLLGRRASRGQTWVGAGSDGSLETSVDRSGSDPGLETRVDASL